MNAIQRANPEMQKRAYNLVRAIGRRKRKSGCFYSRPRFGRTFELFERISGRLRRQIEMDKLPIGDKTLSAKEIIANESQERMGL